MTCLFWLVLSVGCTQFEIALFREFLALFLYMSLHWFQIWIQVLWIPAYQLKNPQITSNLGKCLKYMELYFERN